MSIVKNVYKGTFWSFGLTKGKKGAIMLKNNFHGE